MRNNQTFEQAKDKNLKKLEMYVPVVARVHGPTHPVFYDVQKVYDQLINKINEKNKNLNSEFETLKKMTENYKIPDDVCETYEAVYDMLKELDQAYNN